MGAVLVATGIFLSRVFGLIRTRFQTKYLGAEGEADAFALALRLPNFLQNLLGEGALSASFIPAYAGHLRAGDPARANRLAAAVFARLALITAVIVLGGVALAPLVVGFFTQKWEDAPRELAVTLVRIIFPGTGFLVLSAWCLAVLNSHRKFLLSYTAPVIWNIAIIAFIIYGARAGSPKPDIAVLAAIGAAIGSLLQFLVQLPAVLELTRNKSAKQPADRTDVAEVRKRFGPAVIARGSVQLSGYIDTWMLGLVSGVDGLLALLSYAQTLYQLPISMFGMAVSAAELPEISAGETADSIERDSPRAEELRRRLGDAMRRALFFALPSALALALIGDSIVAVLYDYRDFGDELITATWVVLIGFSIGVVPATLGRVVATSFFAIGDTKTPLGFALARIFFGAFLSAVLLFVFPPMMNPEFLAENPRWRVAGLSIGGSIAFWLELALLYSAFESRVGAASAKPGFVPRVLLGGAAAATVAIAMKLLISDSAGLLFNAALILGFGITYLAVTALLGVSEVATFLRSFRRGR